MERSSKMKRLGGRKNCYLGKKRTSDSLENNFLFRQYLCGKIEGDYEKAVNIFKYLLAFDWDDEKIVKQKFHPMINLDANSFFFYVNCLYFPSIFKNVIEKKLEIPQVFEKLIQRFADNPNFYRKYSPIRAKEKFMNDLNDLFKRQIQNKFENDAKKFLNNNANLENPEDIYSTNINKSDERKRIDNNNNNNHTEEIQTDLENFCSINLNIPNTKENDYGNKNDRLISIDDMVKDLDDMVESLKQKNARNFINLIDRFAKLENSKNQLSLLSTNSSSTINNSTLFQDIELTNLHKESYLNFLKKKHEDFKKYLNSKQPYLRFKDKLNKSYDDSICVCMICNNGDYEDKDLIVYCAKCEVTVHQTCYGITDLPNEDWLCNACCKLENSENLECILCPVKGGAMKETNLKKTSNLYIYIHKLRNSNLKHKQNNSNRYSNIVKTNTTVKCESNINIPDKILTPIKSESNINNSCYSSSLINSNITLTTNSSENEENIIDRNISNTNQVYKNQIPQFKITKAETEISNIPVTEYAWIHMSCALWTPEVEISNFQKKEEIKITENIPKEKFKDKCNICKLSNHGTTKNCLEAICQFKFHVECARINNYSFEIAENNGILEYQIYCNTHRPNKLLKTIETRKIKIKEDVENFSAIILKNLNNFEKENKYSLIKFERKKVSLSINPLVKGKNSSKKEPITFNKNKLKDSSSVNNFKINLSLRDKFSFISQLKYLCKLYSNFDKITLKKIKNGHNEDLYYTFDCNSFKNKIRFSDIKDLKNFPWSMIKVKNYSVDKIKKLFKLLIPNETIYNRKVLKRKIKHKDKILNKNSIIANVEDNQQENFVNVIYENGNENAIIENYQQDESLYCYCLKIYSESDFMINCDYADDCKGAYKGWFHKKCVNELKWKSKKSLIDPKFKFVCKECREFRSNYKNACIISETIHDKQLNDQTSNFESSKLEIKLQDESENFVNQI